jgi:hypothetical protein
LRGTRGEWSWGPIRNRRRREAPRTRAEPPPVRVEGLPRPASC